MSYKRKQFEKKQRNFVAKNDFNKGGPHKDKTKYDRKNNNNKELEQNEDFYQYE